MNEISLSQLMNQRKIIYKNSDSNFKQTKTVGLRGIENINPNIMSQKLSKDKFMPNNMAKTPSLLEKNSSNFNNKYLKTFSTQSWNKIVDSGSSSNNEGFEKETRQYMQEFNIK